MPAELHELGSVGSLGLLDALGAADFSAEERNYVRGCHTFAHEVMAPQVRHFDQQNCFPQAIHDDAFARGLMNGGFPRALGGQELSHRALCAGGVALARVCAPMAFTLGFNHGSLRPVLFAGNDQQKRLYIAELLARRGYASWCMTEPEVSGSNLMAIETRAEETASGFVLSGHKCMIGNGAAASLYFVLADTWSQGSRLGPSIFAVPRGAGVEVGENTPKLGFRCLTTPDVSFHDVEVPHSALLGEVGGGVPVLLDSLDYMRLGGGIVTLGLVLGALDDVLPWLEQRVVYGGERLADNAHIQATLGALAAEAVSLGVLLARVARGLDDGLKVTRDAAALKVLGSDLAQRTTAAVMQVFGWRGIDARHPAEKRFRDARQTSIYEGTNEILSMGLFRALLHERRTSVANEPLPE